MRDATWFDARRARDYPRIIALSWLPVFAFGYWFHVLHGSGSDFAAFWAAGRLVWQDPPLAWSMEHVKALETWFPPGRWVPFSNPPPYLLLVAPFGLLPFWLAHLTWFGSTLALYVISGRRLLGPWVLAAFPPVLLNGIGGQNGLLTAAVTIWGLTLLARRPFLAGLLFGALVMKPQIAILLPVALMAGRHWRAMAGAATSSLGLLGISFAIFGRSSFDAFLAANAFSREVLTSGVHALKMDTVFSLVIALGGGPPAAWAAQVCATMAVIGTVVWAWRQPVDLLAKGAVLAAATPLATPYLYVYDLALLVLPLGWLIGEGRRRGFLPWERLTIGVVFISPLFINPLAQLIGFNAGPFVEVGLLLTAVRALLRRRAESSCPGAGRSCSMRQDERAGDPVRLGPMAPSAGPP